MKLIDIKELSEYIKVKKSTLYSWASSGVIPCYKLNGILRFDKDEIESWIKNSRIQSDPKKPHLKGNGRNLDIDAIIKNAIKDVKGR